ncbi:MAG: GWxTD domain-containing protein, partial [Acidobacteriota bacterium]|nr:GWxTD domain-containing protein [Acidobacteriota bacterium]
MKKVLLAFAALALSVVATAEVTKYKDWPKSPEAYFLTPAERAEWAKLASDSEAETFIAVYYAKRGGDRFKEEIARRIAAADSQFKLRRQRGAESVRGRLLVTLGGPSRVSTSRAQEQGGTTGDAGLNTRPDAGSGFGSASPGAATQTWIYAKDKFDPSWGIGDLSARINVDPARGTDELENADAVNRAVAIVAEKSIVNPAASGVTAAGAAPSAPAAGSA